MIVSSMKCRPNSKNQERFIEMKFFRGYNSNYSLFNLDLNIILIINGIIRTKNTIL